MKSPGQLIAIASFTVIASSACAQEATPDTWINAIDWKSHRELRAELEATRNDSTSRASSANDFFVGRATSTKTRDQLRAERRAARDSAAHDALTRGPARPMPSATARLARPRTGVPARVTCTRVPVTGPVALVRSPA
jgi:hypothetical protein